VETFSTYIETGNNKLALIEKVVFQLPWKTTKESLILILKLSTPKK